MLFYFNLYAIVKSLMNYSKKELPYSNSADYLSHVLQLKASEERDLSD